MKRLIAALALIPACVHVPVTAQVRAERNIEWCVKTRPPSYMHVPNYNCSRQRWDYCEAYGKSHGCHEALEYEMAAGTWAHPF